MTPPVRHMREGLPTRTSSGPDPIAAECDELLERMNRLLECASPPQAGFTAAHLAPPRALPPIGVNADDVRATLADGDVTVPRIRPAKPHRIAVGG